MSDLTTHLRRIASRGHTTDSDNQELFEFADSIDAIDALHQERDLYDGDPYCKSCDEEWPCATWRTLHPRKKK